MSCSINRQKSRYFIHMQKFNENTMFFDLTWKKIFAPGNGGGASAPPRLLPFLYGPEILDTKKTTY